MPRAVPAFRGQFPVRSRSQSVARALALLLGASPFLGGPALAQSYPVYTVTALPLTSFTALNDAGQVLGRAFVPCTGFCAGGETTLLLDTRTGVSTTLGPVFGSGPQYTALNGNGQLAGTATTRDASGAVVRSVVLRQPDGTLTPRAAPTLGSTQVNGLQARGLNASGQIALAHGDGLDAAGPICGNYQGWIGTGATAASWRAVGGAGTVVRLAGLNAGGVGIGSAAPAATCGAAGTGFHAVAARADGTLSDLHANLPGAFSFGRAINDLGYAVGDHDSGERTAPDAYNPQGVAIVRGVVWNIAAGAWFSPVAATGQSRLNAVNNRGEVVGGANPTMVAGQAFDPTASRAVLGNLATPWPMVDLNGLLAGNTAGWVLQEALAINAGGQIVVRGASAAGSGFVLLTPATPPADPYATVPAAPASLAVSQVTATSARLTWTLAARNATRVVVERCRGAACTNFAAVATLPSDTYAYTNAALARRTAYRWRVRAGNAKGLSAPSNAVVATTLR